jgi:hypothetical protein
MVEYSDVFDEVDEFQKKAKVTIDQLQGTLLLGVVCAKPVTQAKLFLTWFL